MEKSTKYCITAITIAFIWFLAQPIGGNMSVEANFDKVPHFNLTNSSISGHAEISGYMPVGMIISMIIIEFITDSTQIIFITLLLLVAYCIYRFLKG